MKHLKAGKRGTQRAMRRARQKPVLQSPAPPTADDPYAFEPIAFEPVAAVPTARATLSHAALRWAPPPRAAPLTNVGNTCFANATLQCLAATPPLAAWARAAAHRNACARHAQRVWCVACALEAQLEQMLSHSRPLAPVLVTRHLVCVLCCIYVSFMFLQLFFVGVYSIGLLYVLFCVFNFC